MKREISLYPLGVVVEAVYSLVNVQGIYSLRRLWTDDWTSAVIPTIRARAVGELGFMALRTQGYSGRI